MRQRYLGDADERGWQLWQKHLATRKQRPLARLWPGRQKALLWAPSETCDVESLRQVIELVRKPRSAERHTAGLDNAVLCWLSRAEVAARDVDFALECLSWCTGLESLAEHLSERIWWQLYQWLATVARAAGQEPSSLSTQLLHAELPLALAYVLPELDESAALAKVARRTLDSSSVDPMDTNGLVHGLRLENLRPLLACWTRMRLVGEAMDSSPWREESLREYTQLVEYALRLSRRWAASLFGGRLAALEPATAIGGAGGGRSCQDPAPRPAARLRRQQGRRRAPRTAPVVRSRCRRAGRASQQLAAA